MSFLIDFVLHIDQHLVTIVNSFGIWTYLILFAIIFIETGAVILPFLPGDSLLFAACALAANPSYGLHIWTFVIIFLVAALAGDSLNFYIGHSLGERLTETSWFGKLINQKQLAKSEKFFEKHGGITVTIARFMPIIRTFVPFVAASSRMNYQQFIRYNVIGCVLWVILCCGGGYYFGNIPFVKSHFSMVVIGIILVSLIPAVFSALRARFSHPAEKED
ncbi:VTT domain-containing protein [Lactiplantibacillus paraplantarum]|uniref:VTT domain-containing protein n=1 Tax=Lactiplantibacillus paraplantarum TaxID=60520 RepID=UPI0005136DC6|nr:VTT domain-containing protein [Lactiplantibacillus paraplantarum]OAX75055.1 cytochrome O ubiquinol oxidase [Lactiplantibacillus plantarum]ALO04596.1 cytochrome O ubiquinol oxidase [Lactiplantibacillus paraplantarum]KGE73997.1 cytochrome O ubiquinol oxidase [Lactiplantibacillus paraplantarum]MCW1910647.1 VTT domain-containing protein [Lactiplantibacillus paraplantarum]RDG08765.1 cytochrome O ubiquinol oxidase [Lactiplantibacillus paraplantarum]